VLRVDDHVAERGFHAPQSEHDVTVDRIGSLDAFEQRRVFLCALLACDNAPVGDAAVEILPDFLSELRLRAI
jgi:hypothetical protein